MKRPEIYFSTDIETNGPIPGYNSMLSLGSAAFDMDGKLLGTYSANLQELGHTSPDEDTMAWWATQPEAWEACRKDQIGPHNAMTGFRAFIKEMCPAGKPVFVAYPAGFDFTFVYWYFRRLLFDCPFGFSAIDIKSYAAAALNCPYTEAVKRNWPKHWRSKRRHTHIALDDAIAQGEEFFNITRDLADRDCF